MAASKRIQVPDHRILQEVLAQQCARTEERLSREAERELGRMRAELLTEFLEVLDNLDRSLAALPPDTNDAVAQGLELVREQFFATLARQGLEVVAAQDEPFDPTVHEAVCTVGVSDPALDRRVLDVVKTGYRLEGTLVRPALVQVGRLDKT